ncbi:MAG TPA: hypothetical protein VFE53_15125 [Mucilaginibacter sp.]|jgi:hypothetical protein|nr:hypothetical protein [Mucilaginibacter sp.]
MISKAKKTILINLVIPVLTICINILEIVKVNGELVLGLNFRLWVYDTGILFFLVVLQVIILIVSIFRYNYWKGRLIVLLISLTWVLVLVFMPAIYLFD